MINRSSIPFTITLHLKMSESYVIIKIIPGFMCSHDEDIYRISVANVRILSIKAFITFLNDYSILNISIILFVQNSLHSSMITQQTCSIDMIGAKLCPGV